MFGLVNFDSASNLEPHIPNGSPRARGNGRCSVSSQRHYIDDKIALFVDGLPILGRSDHRPEPEEIAGSIQSLGVDYLAQLDGGYRIAWYDVASDNFMIAIDRMGIETMAWARTGDALYFSVSTNWVARAPKVNGSISNQALYNYLFFHMVPSPGSVFQGVNKLPAASYLRASKSSTDVKKYWRPSFARQVPFDKTKSLGRTLTELSHAVSSRYTGASSGAFLSGGLDSSTVCGLLSQTCSDTVSTFSIGFGVPEFDELEYARAASTHYGTQHNEYIVAPADVVDALPKIADLYDEPFGNSSAIPTYLCAKFAAQNGCDHLLAGDGGDELFAGNERYTKQRVFEYLNLLPNTTAEQLHRLAQKLIAPDAQVVLLRKLRSYLDQAMIPLPERFESWNFAYREGRSRMFNQDFLAEIDERAPFEEMKNTFDEAESDDLLDKMLYYDWKFTLADNDLRKVTTVCRGAGVDVSFPMLANNVVEYSMEVPSRRKLAQGKLRAYYKDAMQGFLPEKILNKPKHGFGLPFGVWLKQDANLADLVFETLLSLKERRIILDKFIDEIIKEQRDGHAEYYGYVIWDLVILELWFKRQSQH